MNEELLRVIHTEVHRFGITRLASMMGVPERTLYNKVNPHTDEHALTSVQLMQVICITRSPIIIAAIARAAGLQVSVQQGAVAGGESLISSIVRAAKESVDVLAVFQAESSDGSLSLSDAQRLEREGNEAVAAIGIAVATSYGIARAGGRL